MRLSASAMIEAAAAGDIEAIRAMIAAGATAKHFATKTDNAVTRAASAADSRDKKTIDERVTLLRELIAAGCPIDNEAIMNPASGGRVKIVQCLIENGANVNAQSVNREGETALSLAIVGGHAETVNALLAAGADPNQPAGFFTRGMSLQKPPIAIAVEWDRLESLKRLIAAGADINRKGILGATALHDAIESSRTNHVQALIDAEADVNAADDQGVTPLALARNKNDAAIIKLLESASAIVPAQFDANNDLAKSAQNGDVEAIERAIAAGAKPDAPVVFDLRRCSAIILAAEQGLIDALNALLEAGATADAPDQRGRTALFWAAYEGQTDCVRRLIQAGADVNVTVQEMGYGKVTPLTFAARHGHLETVKTLLDAGADPNHRPSSGRTARKLAKDEGYTAIVDLLTVAMKKT